MMSSSYRSFLLIALSQLLCHAHALAGRSPTIRPPSKRTECPMVVVFGRPGAGKSTVAEASLEFVQQQQAIDDCLGLDLDVCVPQWMRDNFANGQYPTLEERTEFCTVCCDYVDEQVAQALQRTTTEEKRIATIISFSFVNTDLRDNFRARFPHSKWVLIDVDDEEATRRINARKGHFYKGKKAVDNAEEESITSTSEVTTVSDDDMDNSEWLFAPVTFDHVSLDGTNEVSENAKRVADILIETLR